MFCIESFIGRLALCWCSALKFSWSLIILFMH
jgi:hypothetical protein